MDSIIKYICPFAFLFGVVNSAAIEVEKCKLDDDACMAKAFQAAVPKFMAGIPDIGVEVMDVLKMDDVSFDLAGLQFSLKDATLTGLKGAVIDKVQWDTNKNQLNIDWHGNVTLKGHYTAGGRVLLLPISGDGQFTTELKNLALSIHIDYKMVTGKDGKKHIKPTKEDFTYEVKDNAHFDMTGLFDGNKELSDTMHALLNDNWKQVMTEFGRPAISVSSKKLFKGMVAFFKSEAIEDIAVL